VSSLVNNLHASRLGSETNDNVKRCPDFTSKSQVWRAHLQFHDLNVNRRKKAFSQKLRMLALGVIEKISSVRSVESLRSRSEMGIAKVCVEARLMEVASDSREDR